MALSYFVRRVRGWVCHLVWLGGFPVVVCCGGACSALCHLSTALVLSAAGLDRSGSAAPALSVYGTQMLPSRWVWVAERRRLSEAQVSVYYCSPSCASCWASDCPECVKCCVLFVLAVGRGLYWSVPILLPFCPLVESHST